MAMCGRIGQASYDERRVAEALLMELRSSSYAPGAAKRVHEKYGLSLDADPDLFLAALADQRYDGDDARGCGRAGRLPVWKIRQRRARGPPPPREIVLEAGRGRPTEPVEAAEMTDRRMVKATSRAKAPAAPPAALVGPI